MRIIGGKVRGRRILSPGKISDNWAIRPTSARAREALFTIIEPKIRGAVVLDLYAGTGALGLEALSRGAQSAVFVEQNVKVVNLIKKNSNLCGFSDRSLIIKRDLTKGLFFLRKLMPPAGFNLAFIDPPYEKKNARATVFELDKRNLMTNNSLVIVESSAEEQMPELIGGLYLYDHRQYGEAGFWLYHGQEA